MTQRSAASAFAPGARVLVRDEEWLVKRTDRTSTGVQVVHALGLSELVRNQEAIFLDKLDAIQELRPQETQLVLDKSPQFHRSRLYLESLLRRTPPTDARIYLGHQGALNDTPFQLLPAHTALSALRPRILIADGVGLGKTVEVGILLSELIKRGRGNRILVVAIKSMLAQFQQEIWARFSIPLVRLDSVGIQRVRQRIPASKNPFYHYNRVIISVDTLKNDAQYRHFLEATRWDVIVIDECHNVANAGSQRNRLADLLARTCDSLILTSATPHNGKPESFANLMTMLEPTAIADPTDYTKEEIDGLFVRRFKKDVAEEVRANFQPRHVHLAEATAGPAEAAYFTTLRRATFRANDALERIRLFKEFLSSPAAAVATLDNRLRTIARQLEERRAAPDRRYRYSVAELEADRATLTELRALAAVVTPDQFGKLRRLLSLLAALGCDGSAASPRVIIFSERLATLDFLQRQLQARFGVGDDVITQFHAGLPDTEQQAIVEDFGKGDSRKRILLASDAASEGVNLHYHCHLMIHFDIPWSLIRLEQRNGRIDRYGQTQPPHIHYLLTTAGDPAGEADLRILHNLIAKEEQAYKNIGDAASIMGLYDPDAEEARITQGVAEGKDLDTIAGEAAAEQAQDEAFDFLALLMGAADDTADDAPADVRAALPSLYPNDFAFADVAFHYLHAAGSSDLQLPDKHPTRPEFEFVAPPDLQRRLTYIPDEAIPAHWLFRLTTDRQAMMAAMAAARKQENTWPALQLFWELHPVMEWLLDRLLAQFGRNEAPVISTPHLPPDHAIFLIQSILSNRRSQPVISEWFGLQRVRGREHAATERLTLDAVLERTRFAAGLAMTGAQPATDWLHALRGEIVTQATDHMRALRQRRGAEIGGSVRSDQRKLHAWYTRAIERIDRELLHADGAKTARLNRQRDGIKALMAQRQTWLKDSIQTVEHPYVRIAAVFCGTP